MKKSLTSELNVSSWSFLSFILIAIVTLVIIVLNNIFPISADIYHHLLTAMGFEKSGGITFTDYWNFAPTGRPNIYPPLFSFLLSLMLKTGLSPIIAARSVAVLAYPLFLITVWFVIKGCLGEREAFFTVVSALLPYNFFLAMLNQLPAAFSIMLLLLIYYFLHKKNYPCITALLGLSFYLHLTIPWVIASALVLYGVFYREDLKDIIPAVLGGILIGSPWIFNVFTHRGYFDFSLMLKPKFLGEIYVLFMFFGIAGIFAAWKQKRFKETAFILLAFLAVLFVILLFNRGYLGRLWGEGLIFLIIFSGIFLNYLYEKLRSKLGSGILIVLSFAIVLIVISPMLLFWVGEDPSGKPYGTRVELCGSTLPRLLFYYQRQLKGSFDINPAEVSLVFDKITWQEAAVVKASSKDGDIIFSDVPYLAGLMGVLSDRFISSGMLYEVKPYDLHRDRISDAAVVIWMKEAEGDNSDIGKLNKKYGLKTIYEDDLVYICKNDAPRAKAVIRKADVTYAQAGLFLFLLFLFAIHKRF